MDTENNASSLNEDLIEETLEALEKLPEDAELRVSGIIREFNETSLSDLSVEIARTVVSELTFAHFSMPVPVASPYQIYRARPYETYELESSFDQLSYRPPNPDQEAGRANAQGQSLFYGSDTVETVFAEKRLDVGSFANVVKCSVKENATLLIVPIGDIDSFRRYHRTILNIQTCADHIGEILRRLHPRKAQAIRLVDAFLSDWMGRVGDEVYPITNAIVQEFLAHEIADGVVFRSVAHPGTNNFAIKPEAVDQKLTPKEVFGHLVQHSFGYGMYQTISIGPSQSIELDGQINWPDDIAKENMVRWPEQFTEVVRSIEAARNDANLRQN